jgi:hypothetical protein
MPQEPESNQKITGTEIPIKFDPLSIFLNLNKPAYYANGLQGGLSPSECYIIFSQNNVQKVAITLPLSTIISLRKLLEKMEVDYESTFGVKIKSTEELVEARKKNKNG